MLSQIKIFDLNIALEYYKYNCGMNTEPEHSISYIMNCIYGMMYW